MSAPKDLKRLQSQGENEQSTNKSDLPDRPMEGRMRPSDRDVTEVEEYRRRIAKACAKFFEKQKDKSLNPSQRWG